MKNILYSIALISLFVALMLLMSCPGVKPEVAPIVVPPTIQLISPENGKIFIGPQEVTLKWEHDYELFGGGIEYYRVYLDTASSFPNAYIGASHTKYYDTDTLKEDVYYWKVVLYDDDHGGVQYASEISSFAILPPTDSIKLLWPEDGVNNISGNSILNWELISKTGKTDYTFDVYLDTVDPPDSIIVSDTTSFTVQPTLLCGTTYYWKVVGKLENEENIESETWSFSTLYCIYYAFFLSSPANEAMGVELDARLEWEASIDPDVVNYDVYLDTNNPPTTKVGQDITETFVEPSLLPETTYYWQVLPKDEDGEGRKSDVWSFTTKKIVVVLTLPENGAIDVPLDVTLEWQAATDLEGDVVTYDVLLDTNPAPVTVVASGIAELSYQPVVVSGTTYYWQVIGMDELGGTSSSVVLSFTTENHAPSAVVLTSPANGSISVDTDVTLEWAAATDPDGDAVTYNVLLMEANNPPATVVASGITELSFAPSLEPGTTYIWQVSCIDRLGERSESEQWSFTTKNNVVVITQPEDGATDVPLDVTLEWQAAADLEGDQVTYDVLLDMNPNPVIVVASGIPELSYQPVVVSGTTYYWQVIGKDELGGTSASAILNFTTINTTSNEVILLTPDNNASEVPVSTELTWELKDDPGGVVYEYDIYLDVNNPPTTMVGTHVTQLSFWPTLSQGTSYYWKVVGQDYGSGSTIESAAWKFTTEGGSSTGSIQDIRDGQVYETEAIGKQIWMARNLAYLPALSDSVKVYGYEGTDINEATSTDNYNKYGVLYSWQAAMDGASESSSNPSGVQGVCPTGWHLPSVNEWNELRYFIEGEGNAATGIALKATEGWLDDGNGTDIYGFNGQASGQYYNGQFTQLGLFGYWWSTVEYYNDNGVPIVWYRSLSYTSDYIRSGSVNTDLALWSVRCIKDD